jgi:hypothetical protein
MYNNWSSIDKEPEHIYNAIKNLFLIQIKTHTSFYQQKVRSSH